MTGDWLQIRTERRGQASALTTAVPLQPGRRPFRARTCRTTSSRSPACRATPALSCPSLVPVPSSIAAPSSPADPSCPAATGPSPLPGGRPPQIT